jgi:hypothetical protein
MNKDTIIRKQSAKKGWVADIMNDTVSKIFMSFKAQINQARAETDTYIEILEKILIDKLGITQSDIDKIKSEISSRNTKDNGLLNKYWLSGKGDKAQNLEIMKKEGLSEKIYIELQKQISTTQPVIPTVPINE